MLIQTSQVNPLTGAGGNAALESAACLSDLLVEYLRKTNNRPDSLSIQQLFTRFAAKRGPRAVKLMKASAGLQDIEALASPFARLLALHVLSKFRLTDILQQGFSVSNLPGMSPLLLWASSNMYGAYETSTGVSLRYLPAPQRQQKGLLPFQENISIQPGERPMAATFAALSILCVLAFTPYYLPTESTGSSSSELLGLYTYTLKTAIVLIWTVESSRPMAFLSALGRYFIPSINDRRTILLTILKRNAIHRGIPPLELENHRPFLHCSAYFQERGACFLFPNSKRN
jgi:hypothetical protein